MKKKYDDTAWINGDYLNNTDLKQQFEARVKTNHPMDNFQLSNANLENINLVHSGSKEGYKLINSNLYKSNFKDSHCFKLDLSGSSLMKANFSNANLHFANLQNCNLLGTNFHNAKLDNVIWDKIIIQEREAEKTKIKEEQIDYYQQAEEIYRNLRKTTEEDGLFETAGYFFQKEMQMRRKKMPLYSFRRIFSKFVDFSCGYGERPLRIILLTMIILFIFSLIYLFSGIYYLDEIQRFSIDQDLSTNFGIFLNCLYFSIVTFTTTGYGDIFPIGITKIFASMEMLLGGFILAIFVIVFVKKMTR